MSKRIRPEAEQERGEPSAIQERLNWRSYPVCAFVAFHPLWSHA